MRRGPSEPQKQETDGPEANEHFTLMNGSLTQSNTQKGLMNGLKGHWAFHCLVGLVLIIEISVLTIHIVREHLADADGLNATFLFPS